MLRWIINQSSGRLQLWISGIKVNDGSIVVKFRNDGYESTGTS